MDRIEPVATAPPDEQAPTPGVGSEFRAAARGTSTERRRRSAGGLSRAERALATAPVSPSGDTGTWRLAL